jgi:Ca2+-binding EF-hand superfamily protein
MFKNMDTNNDGVIDIKEFKAAIIEAGFDPDSEELQASTYFFKPCSSTFPVQTCVRLFDSNRDGSIDYQEFLQFVRNNKNTKAYKR